VNKTTSIADNNRKRIREVCQNAGYADVKFWLQTNVIASADEFVAEAVKALEGFQKANLSNKSKPTKKKQILGSNSPSSKFGAPNNLPRFERNFRGAVGLANWIKRHCDLFFDASHTQENTGDLWPTAEPPEPFTHVFKWSWNSSRLNWRRLALSHTRAMAAYSLRLCGEQPAGCFGIRSRKSFGWSRESKAIQMCPVG